MKQKIRTKCPNCKKSKNFYLIKRKGKSFYKCNNCGSSFHHINNLKLTKKIILPLILITFLFLTSCNKQLGIKEEYKITFRLKPDQKVNYVFEFNNSIIKQGILETTFNDLEFKKQTGIYKIYYWNNDYYVDSYQYFNYPSRFNQTITKEFKLDNKNKKGNISISLSNKIRYSDNEQRVDLIFKSNNTVKQISYCIYRTVGFIYVIPENDISICNGKWTNTTPYGNLSDNRYYCNNLIRECTKVDWQGCYNKKMEVPKNINADDCYFTGKTLYDNEEYIIPLKLKTMNYFDPDLDYIEIYVFDMDLNESNRILRQVWGYQFSDNQKT